MFIISQSSSSSLLADGAWFIWFCFLGMAFCISEHPHPATLHLFRVPFEMGWQGLRAEVKIYSNNITNCLFNFFFISLLNAHKGISFFFFFECH